MLPLTVAKVNPVSSRAIQILLALLLATTALSGCFGGDDHGKEDEHDHEGHDHGDDMMGDDANNTTMEPEPVPNVAPTASIGISFEIEGNASEGERVQVVPGTANVSIILDSSGSTDSDGNVTAQSWTVTDPDGETYKSTSAEFRLDLDEPLYGGWLVELRVQDDDGDVSAALDTFAMDYINTFSDDTGFSGPATEARQGSPQDRPAGHLLGATYDDTRGVTLAEGMKMLTVTVEFTAGTGGGQLAGFLFAPGVTDTQDAEPLVTAPKSASPLVLTADATQANETGRHTIRIDLDGQSVSDYSGTVVVEYELIDLLSGDPASTGGSGNSTAGNGTADNSTGNETDGGGQNASLPEPLGVFRFVSDMLRRLV